MRIYRTSSYLRSVKKLFSDAQLDEVDAAIAANPENGVVIAGTGGLRKMRVAASGRGKSGGARVIYYYWQAGESSYLIYAYNKNKQEDMSSDEKKMASQLVMLIKRGVYEN